MAKGKSKSKKLTLSKVNKKINKLIGTVETKYKNFNIPYTTVSTAGNYIEYASLIDKGVAADERVGDKIHLSHLQLRGQMKIGTGIPTSLNDAYNQIRMLVILFMDNNTTGSTPDAKDILDFDPLTDPVETQINALYRKNPTFTYRVLHDKIYTLNWRNASGFTPAVGASGAPQINMFNIRRKLNSNVHYNTDPSGSTTHNGFVPYVIILSDSGTTPHPDININARLQWTDL